MSENPYAQSAAGPSSFDDLVEPERTSLLAVGSLICSLTCCLSPIGLLLGIGSMLRISSSGGRVGGKGLAIAGIVLGLLGTVLIVGSYIGVQQMARALTNELMPMAGEVVGTADRQEYDELRVKLSPPSNALATDAQIDRFRETYRNDLGLGAYQGTPTDVGLLELILMYMPFNQSMQSVQGRNDVIPLVGVFENGNALVLVFFDQEALQQQQTRPDHPLPVVNIQIMTEDGSSASLLDPMVIEAARSGRLEELFPGTDMVELPDPEAGPEGDLDAGETDDDGG